MFGLSTPCGFTRNSQATIKPKPKGMRCESEHLIVRLQWKAVSEASSGKNNKLQSKTLRSAFREVSQRAESPVFSHVVCSYPRNAGMKCSIQLTLSLDRSASKSPSPSVLMLVGE